MQSFTHLPQRRGGGRSPRSTLLILTAAVGLTVLAGCSAGAMMLGGYTLSVRAVMRGQPPRWLPALGIAPGIVLMPHFDRVADFAGADLFRAMLEAAPAGTTLVGVDEDTALVYVPHEATPSWQVIGRQTVSVFDREGVRAIYRAGEPITLATL